MIVPINTAFRDKIVGIFNRATVYIIESIAGRGDTGTNGTWGWAFWSAPTDWYVYEPFDLSHGRFCPFILPWGIGMCRPP